MSSYMSIAPYREYTVDADHLGSKPLTPTVPVFWLREHFRPQEKATLGIESNTRALIIGTPEQIERINALIECALKSKAVQESNS